MANTKIEQDKIEMSGEHTMTAANRGVISSLIPLVAASLGTAASSLDLTDYSNEISNNSAQFNVGDRPSARLEISEGVDISQNSLSSLIEDSYQNDINIRYSHAEEFKILENFIGDILENKEQQPGKLKSLMYDNIDDLLI